MIARRSLLLACLTFACSRSPARGPQGGDAGGSPRSDVVAPLDAVAPAILQRMREGLPDVPPTPDAGNGDRLTTSALGNTAQLAGPHFLVDLAATRRGNGGEGTLTIRIRGAEGYTVDANYPITVEASATALELDKTSLRRVDARPYTPQLARFEVGLRGAEAGETVVTELLFSVCRGTDCEFISRRMVVVVP